MTTLFGGKALGRELPQPRRIAMLLIVFAAVAWLVGLGGLLYALGLCPAPAAESCARILGGLSVLVAGLLTGGVLLGFALVVKYAFSAAVSAKLMERNVRSALERTGGQEGEDGFSAGHEEVISLLAEITENTLLDEAERATKRQWAKKHRQQTLRREIEALIQATKFREAQERLEEFRTRYTDAEGIAELETKLSDALREHEQAEIARVSDQVHRYMGLGMWDRAVEMARGLAEQYPENQEAARLPETVALEQNATRRQEQQRLYREIEHLASRRHWRQALRVAENLLENHPDSPEANTLKGQMEELRRNAGILERREWEERITEHVQTGRHHEAYDLAVELMEKYPDSPQAQAIRERLDQLKYRAGVID